MFINVAIPVPVRSLFTYDSPEGFSPRVGNRVVVPFGSVEKIGLVIETNVSPSGPKIKEVKEVVTEEPLLTPAMAELLKWIASYYCAPIGEVARTALPKIFFSKIKKVREKSFSLEELENIFKAPAVRHSAEQLEALKELKAGLSGGFKTTLLHGVTGSGKTEVYLKLFEEVLAQKKEAILLVPEIGMTPQAVGRIASRFKDKVAVYNSSLSDARRLYEWRQMAEGRAKILIGTRSAVFAPFKKLGLIVIDEEHDSSYKQDEAPRYNGRDCAIMRGKIENIPVLIGSATPSIEALANVQAKKYGYIRLTSRPTGAPLPQVEIVDMRSVPKGSFLSAQLLSRLSETMEKKEQALLFINRRGFASFVFCPDCGTSVTCPNCNISLTYHKEYKSLLCHYCELKAPVSGSCKKCGSRNIRAFGTGTERIEEDLGRYFPKARIVRFDRDTTAKAGNRGKMLSMMKKGEADIVVGTQMITKGHDFPNVTLVGVIDADLSLNFPDFRSAERTFQLLTQVSGRAGRGNVPGTVVVQTFTPEHYAIQMAMSHDPIGFFKNEIPMRRELRYPPFGRASLIKFTGLNQQRVEKFAESVADRLSGKAAENEIEVLGPSPAPIAKVRGKYRWHILLKTRDSKNMTLVANEAVAMSKEAPKGVSMALDVDVMNIL